MADGNKQSNDLIYIQNAMKSSAKAGTPVDDIPPTKNNNDGGGGRNMKHDDYVTRKEFEEAKHDIDMHFEHINTQFAEQKVWFY